MRGTVVGVVAVLALGAGAAGVAAADDPAVGGRWSAPFAEPTINGQPTDDHCVTDEAAEHDGTNVTCKPTAGSMAVLGGPDVLYWDALEDMEEVELAVAAEFGTVSVNDQSRLLHLDGSPTWTALAPPPEGENGEPTPLFGDAASDETYNDGALFCAALTFLPDGRVLAVGGTGYYQDPAVTSKYGVVELEGLEVTRIFDPATRRWSRGADLGTGRWYPTAVPLPDGRVFVASGVTHLIKPVEPTRAPTESGRNVVTTETFDPASGAWTTNPETANRSLPLYPRLHLLPGGRIYFNTAGQVFNPMGFAYDELLWNVAAVYDPQTQTWEDVGIPGMGTPAPGFRGSTFSIMLPLTPEDGYTKARFLTAGGVLGTSPGGYVAVSDSRIDTVDTTTMSLSSASTSPLNQPRWYGTGVLTPTGEVLVLSGASADEVVGPGSAIPVTQPELFDPETGEWTVLAGAKEKRTYHNTAALLPDGRILVGGHAPISTLYTHNRTLVPGTTSPQETRNPTFEIFEPPYLFRGDRPTIDGAPSQATPGDTIPITLDIHGDEVGSVTLVRRTAVTHLVDGGQRAVELEIVERKPNRVTVRLPGDPSVVPPGPYLLFVNRTTASGLVPSVAEDLTVLAAPMPAGAARATAVFEEQGPPVRDLAAAGAVPIDAELAFHEIAELNGHGHGDGDGGATGTPWSLGLGAVAVVAVSGWWWRRRVSLR